MSENIINATIAIFNLFLGFILGLIYGWFQGFSDCAKEITNEKRR